MVSRSEREGEEQREVGVAHRREVSGAEPPLIEVGLIAPVPVKYCGTPDDHLADLDAVGHHITALGI